MLAGDDDHADRRPVRIIDRPAVGQAVGRDIIHVPKAQVPAGVGLAAVMPDVPVGALQAVDIALVIIRGELPVVVHHDVDGEVHADVRELRIDLRELLRDLPVDIRAGGRGQNGIKILIDHVHHIDHVAAVDRVAVADLLEHVHARLTFLLQHEPKGEIGDRADRDKYGYDQAEQAGIQHGL